MAHLKDGRRLRLALNDLDLGEAAWLMGAGLSRSRASGAFLNWACHNQVIFAKKPGEDGAWRLGRRRANARVDASGEADLLVHPQAWNDSEADDGLLYNRASMKGWWAEFSSQLSARVAEKLSAREREALAAASRPRGESAILDEKIAAAFPASMRSEAKAALEKMALAKEVSRAGEKNGEKGAENGDAEKSKKKAARL